MAISKIKTDSIADAAITSDKIATGGISTADLADGAITSDKIANDAISTAALVNGAVTDTKLATGSVENYFGTQGFALGMRNRIINGDMRIDQRNAGASVSVSPNTTTFITDRFNVRYATGSGLTSQQSTAAPTGFVNSLLVTVGTADSVAAPANNRLLYAVEGRDISDLAWGTAQAQTITLSFWVRCSLTGTFSGALRNSDGTRSYPFTYNVSAADTWEKKTITVPGETTGTWLTDNGVGLFLYISLGFGSDFQGTSGAWAAADFRAASGETPLISTSGATFNITGVQLEAGSVATPFERRPYGTEFMLCQRYFSKLNNDGSGGSVPVASGVQSSTTTGVLVTNYPVTMRAEPTAIISNIEATDFIGWTETATQTSFNAGFNTAQIQVSHNAQGAQYRPMFLRIATDTTGFISFSAEL